MLATPLAEIAQSATRTGLALAPAYSGFDWGDAGIGAAGLLALLSIGGGVTLLAVGRRRRRDIEAPAH